MKDYKKFISEQVELTEKLQALGTVKPTSGFDPNKANSIAGTRGVSVKVEPSGVALINAIDSRSVYNFSNFLQNFADLSNMVISADQAKGYKQVLDQMDDSDSRKLMLMQEIENAMLMPKSAERTTKVSNVLASINYIGTEMAQNSLPYDQRGDPKTYIPDPDMTNRTFGRRG